MAEPSLSDQSYGHFGQPVYHAQSKRWIFGRSAINSWQFQPMEGISNVIAGTKVSQDEDTTVERQNQRYDRALNKEIRKVVQGNPEIHAAEDILAPLIRASEAVVTTVAQYDPAVGDILAFGTAVVSDGQNRHNQTRLLAIPGGEGGEMLRLVRLEMDTYGWNEGDARLLVPSPSQQVAWWVGKGAPIQQICTPEILSQGYRGSFVAVRLPGTTFLFRPRYRTAPVPPAGVHLGCTLPPSRVDANLLLEITPRTWEGQHHADVSFNPWNQHQMAVVDQAGDWAILRNRREDKGSQVYSFKIAHRGSLEGFKTESKVEKKSSATQQDGWARILWVADRNTLLVCTRRQFQLFALSLETTLTFSSFLTENHWILDVRRCPAAPTWVFVLTSMQVLWLEILPESDRGIDVVAKAGKILLSSYHFRDSSDISLQMNIENDPDAISILLWSRTGPLVTCLRFDRQEAIAGLPAIVGVPTELLLPVSANNKLPTAALSVRRLDYEAGDGDAYPMLTTSRPTIYSIQLLTDDLALHHAFLSTSDNPAQEPPHHIAKPRVHVRSVPVALDDDDFIVPDEISPKKRFAEAAGCVSQKVNYAGTGNQKKSEDGRTVHNETISGKVSGTAEQENRQDIIDIAIDLQDLILDDDVLGLGEPAQTLLEQAFSLVPDVGELAETSDALSDLLSLSRPGAVPDEAGVAVKRLMVPTWASPMNTPSGELDFGRLYNHIVDHQLAPLADEIPPRIRMRREKLTRTIAAEFILSSSRIELLDPASDSQEQAAESQETRQSLPFQNHTSGKEKEHAFDTIPSSSQLSNFMSSQSMPTPSPSASRATSTIISGTTTSLPSHTSRTILSRLSRHVTFSPPSSWATRPMTLLAHWDIHRDPSTYDYTSKLSELEKQRQEESMTDKQRLKAREKAERRLKRQRREAEKARSGLVSSQPMVMSSQVRGGGSQYGGSQFGGSQFGGSQYGRSSPPLPSSPPPMVENGRDRQRGGGTSSQAIAPPMVGSNQAPMRRGDGQAKKKKRKREGF